MIQGSPGQKAWAWDNFGDLAAGWPKTLGGDVTQTAAMGDIDQDGSFEVAFLIQTPDLRGPIGGGRRQHARSARPGILGDGRLQCPAHEVLLLLRGSGDPGHRRPGRLTRVSFAPPSPNPSSGSANFHFSLPGPAVVNLEVFDVRGHRVSLVTREQAAAGHHVATWNGLGDGGRILASGTYFARLRAQGPGIREE